MTDRFSHLSPIIRAALDRLNDRIALVVNNSTYTAFVVASSGDVLWWTSRPGMPVGLHITDINGVDLTNPERIMRALPAVGRLVTEIVRVWGMRRARQEAQDAHDQTIADTIDSLPITNGDDQ